MAGSSGSSRQQPASQMAAPRDLMRAMLAFGAMLRFNGLTVTTGALMDSIRAFETIDLLDRHEIYLALRALLVSRTEEQPIFDRCFDAFWRVGTGYGANFEQSAAEVGRFEERQRATVARQRSVESARYGDRRRRR